MRMLSRFLLKVVGVVSPVFIAACYGMQISFEKAGQVIDSVSHVAIPGIRVECSASTGIVVTTYTDSAGGFDVVLKPDKDDCTALVFTDTDGTANGSYQAKSVPVVDDGVAITVELDTAP